MPNNALDIVIVEDDLNAAEIMKQHLSDQGFKVESFDSVKKALGQIKKHKPKLTFVDLFLPELDGFDLAEKILALDPDLKIVLMSGIYDFNENHLKNLGLEDFLKKPIDFIEMEQVLKKYGLKK